MNGSLLPAGWMVPVLALPALLSGCLLAKAVTAPVKLAATTVVVVGETATTVVKTTGKVARSAVNAGGSATSAGLDGVAGVAQLSQVGMVTFVDVASGAIVRVPWEQGLTLAQVRNFSTLQLTRRAVDLVRAGEVVYAAKRYAGTAVPLAAGDVVRLAP